MRSIKKNIGAINKLPIVVFFTTTMLMILLMYFFNDITISLYALFVGIVGMAAIGLIIINPFWGLILIVLYGQLGSLVEIPVIAFGSRLIGIILTIGWFLKYFIGRKTLFFKLIDFNRILLIFSLIMILSSLLAVQPGASLKTTFLVILFIAMTFFIQDLISDKKKLNIFVVSIALSVGIASLIGLIQYAVISSGMDAFGRVLYTKTGDIGRIGGIGGINSYAIFLMSGIPFLIFLVFNSKKDLLRLIFFCFLITSIISLGLTVSRTYILAFVFFMATYIFFSFKNNIISKKHVFFLLILIVILSIFLSGFLLDYMTQRSFTFEDNSSMVRYYVFIEGIRLLIENPVLGVGFNNFQLMHHDDSSNVSQERSAHDLVSKIFTSTGFLGSFIIIVLFYKTLKNLNLATRNFSIKSDKYLLHFSIVLKSAYIAQLFTWFGSPFILYRTFWIYTALAVVIYKWSTLHEKTRKTGTDSYLNTTDSYA